MRLKSLTNVSSLLVIQISNAVTPLVIFPFVLSKVGALNYSLLSIAEMISILTLAIVVYSFEIDGVERVIKNLNNNAVNALSNIFSTILFSRLLLFFTCAFLSILICYTFDISSLRLIAYWQIVPFAYILQSFWFFQGIEQNYFVALTTIFSRLLALLTIYLYIKTKEDYFLVPLIIGICYLLSGIANIIYIVLHHGIRIHYPGLRSIKKYLYSGREIFLSNVSVFFYRDINLILLSYFSVDPNSISAYSIAEKYVKVVQASIRPFSQFYFPRTIKLLMFDNLPTIKAFKLIAKQTIPQLIVLFSINLALFLIYYLIYTGSILRGYFSQGQIFYYYAILQFSVYFGVSNFMFGSVGLNTLGAKKYFTISIFLTGCLNIVLCLFLIYMFGAIGAVFSFVFSELCLFLLILKKYLSGNNIS